LLADFRVVFFRVLAGIVTSNAFMFVPGHSRFFRTTGADRARTLAGRAVIFFICIYKPLVPD
jgi:hypothetical protein